MLPRVACVRTGQAQPPGDEKLHVRGRAHAFCTCTCVGGGETATLSPESWFRASLPDVAVAGRGAHLCERGDLPM